MFRQVQASNVFLNFRLISSVSIAFRVTIWELTWLIPSSLLQIILGLHIRFAFNLLLYSVMSCCPGCEHSRSGDELGSRECLRAPMFQGTHSKWGYKPDSNPGEAGSKAHDTYN